MKRRKQTRLIGAIHLLVLLLAACCGSQLARGDEAQLCRANAVTHPEKAIEFCSVAIRNGGFTKTQAARLFNSRGMAYQTLRDYSAAIRDYDQSIHLNPTAPDVYNNRGTAYHSRGIYDRAIEDYTKAIELDHANPVTFRSRAISHFCLGHFDEAQKDLELAMDLNPSDSFTVIWLYLAEMRRDGVTSMSLSNAASGLKLTEWPGQVIRLFSGTLDDKEFLNSLDGSNAKDSFRQCEALFFLGEYLLLKGERARAVELFQSAVATRLTDDFEYTAAMSELQRLRHP